MNIQDEEVLSLYGGLLEQENYTKLEVARIVHMSMQGFSEGSIRAMQSIHEKHEKELFQKVEEFKEQLTKLWEGIQKSIKKCEDCEHDKSMICNGHIRHIGKQDMIDEVKCLIDELILPLAVNKKEDGLPPTSKEVGIRPTIL